MSAAVEAKVKAAILKDHEVKRLAAFGEVRVVRPLDSRFRLGDNGLPIREVAPSLLVNRGDLWDVRYDGDNPRAVKHPFGAPGDRCWVREAFAVWQLYGGCKSGWKGHEHVWGNVVYKATFSGGLKPECEGFTAWKPPTHMARWASRYTVEVASTDVVRSMEIRDGEIDPACYSEVRPWWVAILKRTAPDAS